MQTLAAELTAQVDARRHNDGGIALDTAQHAIYGDHPYGWTPSTSPQEFTKLTARDAQAFYGERWRPANIELIVVGDVEVKRAGAVLSEVLGRWRGREGAAAPVALPPPPPPPPSQVIVIDRPAAKQVTVVSATRLGPRSAPAWYAAIVANRVLGGGFDSRLNTTLRLQKSYVYAIRSYLVATAAGGFLYAATSTKAENAGATAREIFDQLDGLRSRPPGAREFEIARNASRLMRALALETNADIANALAEIVGLRLASGELAAAFGKLDAVTGEDVQAIATEQMTAQRTSMVIVGPAGSLLPQLRAQGLSPILLPAQP